MVVTTGYPFTAHKVTYIHNLFQNGAATLWLYEGGWMEETRYWYGRRYSRLEHDYQPRTYVRAEIVVVNGQVVSWRTLPQPVY